MAKLGDLAEFGKNATEIAIFPPPVYVGGK